VARDPAPTKEVEAEEVARRKGGMVDRFFDEFAEMVCGTEPEAVERDD
jgi:hypothetical protein